MIRHLLCNCLLVIGENFNILWSKLRTTLFNANSLESNLMFSFLENLDRKHETMFLLGGLSSPRRFTFTIQQQSNHYREKICIHCRWQNLQNKLR